MFKLMGPGRRMMLWLLCSGVSVVAAGCNQPQTTRSLSLGMVRVVNLDESSVDVRLVLSSIEDETAVQSAQSLHGFNTNGNAQADELVYRPESPMVTSDYKYLLYVNNKSVMNVDGQQAVSNYEGNSGKEACLLLHFFINEMESDISYSIELSDECELPS